MRKIFTPLLFSVFLLAGLAGCDGGTRLTSPGTPAPEGVDLDNEYGGFTFDDELPAFGESSLFADEQLAEDTAYEDEYENDPTVSAMTRRNGARVFTLRINWGKVLRPGPQDSSNCADQAMAYNWDGSLTVDRGAIILRRTILFEPGDYIHKREDRRTLEWSSATGPHFDGILVNIIDPPHYGPPDSTGGDHPDPGPNHVTFKTPLYSRTFTMDELIRISEVVPVNRCGVGVAFNGFLEPGRPCPHGFLSGVWKPVPQDSIPQPPGPPDTFLVAAADTSRGGEVLGHFYGNWIEANGVLAGRLKGVYGINSEGLHVFFGKYIDFSGRFKGILRGRYGSMSEAPYADTAGWFQGEWIGRARDVTGHLRGHWAAAPNRPGGLFNGRWHADCPDMPPENGVASLN